MSNPKLSQLGLASIPNTDQPEFCMGGQEKCWLPHGAATVIFEVPSGGGLWVRSSGVDQGVDPDQYRPIRPRNGPTAWCGSSVFGVWCWGDRDQGERSTVHSHLSCCLCLLKRNP